VKQLSEALLAAQRGASGVPYVRAVFGDYAGDRPRLRPRTLYVGSEPHAQHAAVVAFDGALVRARVQSGTLYVQRVANPGPGANFSSWTSLGAVSSSAGIALMTGGGSGGEIMLVHVATDNVSLRYFYSFDGGVTWQGPASIATAGAAVAAVCGAFRDVDNERVVFWSEGATVYRSRWVAGTGWGARTAWTNSVASITGLAVTFLFDWQVIVTGTQTGTGDAYVWACIYGDGFSEGANTWGTLRAVAQGAAGSGVSYRAPAVAVAGSCFRLFFVESYSGAVAYDRVYWSTLGIVHDFNQEQWQEPVAFPFSGSLYGVAAAAPASLGALYVTMPSVVWYSALPASAEVDVSERVVEASVEADARGARARLVLDNEDGKLTAYGSGELGALRRGWRLELSPGYVGTGGAEAAAAPYTYWVESVELQTGPERRVVVTARDGWWLLEGWRARRQFAWSAGQRSVSQLLFFVVGRAGLEYASVSASGAITSLQPAFTIHPGEDGAGAVRRLLSMVEDVAYFDGGTLTGRLVRTDDEAVYAFGGGDGHVIAGARYREVGPEVNRARVVGAGFYGEEFDFDGIESVGERVAQVLDLNLDAAGEVTDRAAAVLRKAALEGRGDELAVFGVHCGVELYDVVTVTDEGAGLAGALRRVLGYEWRYEGRRGRYEMRLQLGAV